MPMLPPRLLLPREDVRMACLNPLLQRASIEMRAADKGDVLVLEPDRLASMDRSMAVNVCDP